MNKKGYKELLGDIGDSNRRITKVKRGLSVFSDSTMRSQLLSSANAPVISEENLSPSLQKVILSPSTKGNDFQTNASLIKTSLSIAQQSQMFNKLENSIWYNHQNSQPFLAENSRNLKEDARIHVSDTNVIPNLNLDQLGRASNRNIKVSNTDDHGL